jgi:hypothetical protein
MVSDVSLQTHSRQQIALIATFGTSNPILIFLIMGLAIVICLIAIVSCNVAIRYRCHPSYIDLKKRDDDRVAEQMC